MNNNEGFTHTIHSHLALDKIFILFELNLSVNIIFVHFVKIIIIITIIIIHTKYRIDQNNNFSSGGGGGEGGNAKEQL